jgi:hypothetical protein
MSKRTTRRSWLPPPLWTSPLLLAVVFTALASLKPIHIDEAANYYYAIHIADHPLDPFGFEVFWYERPEPANWVLTPPVLVSWWALGVRLLRPLGEQPVLWKLGLLPFALLFVLALHALLRRFARGLQTPLLWMTVLSPAILPGLNLMPDIPALAFSLAAVAVFLHATDVEGGAAYGWSLLAGGLAGLAMQTKYTGFTTLPVLLAAALLLGRLRCGFLALVPAVGLFAAWEVVTAHLYGDSHFLLQVRGAGASLDQKLRLLLPLLTLVGGTAPALGLLGLAALGVRRPLLVAAGIAIALGYMLIARVGVTYKGAAAIVGLDADPQTASYQLHLSDLLFAAWGLGLVAIAAAVVGRLCRLGQREGWEQWRCWRRHRVEWFLAAWLVLEIAGYFALTPFPAVRRVLGIIVAATLLGGRLASYTCRSPERRAIVRAIAGFSVVLGLLFQGVDLCDAHAQKRAAEMAARLVRDRDPEAVLWYVGHWGFQYHAERAGMKPVVPDVSRLRAGDWLVVPDDRLEQQWIVIPGPAREEMVWSEPARVPWRTVRGYYGGWTPLEHQQGPRLEVRIYRLDADCTPVSRPAP